MNKRQDSGHKTSSNQPLEAFSRWFCGHNASKGIYSQKNMLRSMNERYFSYRSLAGRGSRNRLNFESALSLNLEHPVAEKLGQWIESIRSQDWLQPLPNLKNASVKRKVPPTNVAQLGLSRRDEFLMYGSAYLQRREDLANAGKGYSPIATFFAGSLLDRSWINFDARAEGRKTRSSALSSRSSRTVAASSIESSLAACQTWLRKLSAPPSLIYPEIAAKQALYDLGRFQGVQRWPLTIALEPWSTSLQVSTAIAIALPAILSSVQMQPAQNLKTSGDISGNLTNTASNPANPAIDPVATAPVPSSQAVPTAKPAPLNLAAASVLNTSINQVVPLKVAATSLSNPLNPSNPKAPTFAWPAQGHFTSGFGWRWDRMHRGVDIAGPVGTPVWAAADGKVITARWDATGFGYMIEIEHPDKSVTLYAHNERILTKVGAKVEQGDQIAEMGSTGNSTGSHVHFQVHPKGKDAVDPMVFLPITKIAQK
jgi:murein DD-endopeptidase MepM/ murein hydrolase activator NlpD